MMKTKKNPLRFNLLFKVSLFILSALIFYKTGVNFNRLNSTTTQELGITQLKTNAQIKSTHPLIYYDAETFWKGIIYVDNKKERINTPIMGGIVPHHLLPSFILADFFSRLKTQSPTTLILVGPNHQELGNFLVLTSYAGWNTPFGIVQTDTDLIEKFSTAALAKTDDEILSQEHSVAGLMPYIKYYLPDTKVVPLVLSGKMREMDLTKLTNVLSSVINTDQVLVAAVDFSHYLSEQASENKDAVTLKLIQEYNYLEILKLNNDHLDSPPAIALILILMKRFGKQLEIIHHTNSGELLDNDSLETTSYFGVIYK